ncbi:MAG: SHOCT domain-containing protein [Natronospirillum sp.]
MQTNLKTLSRQYANGTLSKEEYRRARMDLLETVQENDQTQPQVTMPFQPAAELEVQGGASNDELPKKDAGPTQTESTKTGISPSKLVIVLALCIVVAVILATFLL